MAQDQQMFRRAANAAIVGLVVQVIFTIVMGIVSVYAACFALNVAVWEFLGGLPIWVVLLLIFHQHRLERAEALEAEQLARADATTAAIFDEHGADLQIARRRLDFLYKWGLGGVSLLEGVYLLTIGALCLWSLSRTYSYYKPLNAKDFSILQITGTLNPNANAGVLLAIMVVIGLVAFLVARYEAGMARVTEWQLLRGGAAFLMGNLVIAVLLTVGLVAVLMGNVQILQCIGLAMPVILIVLGAEILLTFLLGAYRPRQPGEVPRPAFDSRLLGMFTSPKSLAKALSDAVNYQFGFEVSRSWFYQLLGQAITPLVAFSILVLLLMSTIVIVAPQQQALILKNGAIQGDEPVGPGLHFKWPWPVGSVQIEDVGRLQEFSLGSAVNGLDDTKAILWTNTHAAGDEKEQYLVAAPTPLDAATADDISGMDTEGPDKDAAAKERTPGISLVGLQVMVQYRIQNLRQYVMAATDVPMLLREIVQRQLNAYLVTQDIDHLIGPVRITAGEELRRRIQRDVDLNKLGVQIVFTGLIGVHPPAEGGVADAFQQQIEVLQQNQTKKERARADEINLMASVAGSLEQANQVKAAIKDLEADQRDLEQLQQSHAGADKLAAKQKEIDGKEADIQELLAKAQGLAAEMIHRASADRWELANGERAKAERFLAELTAYRQAPALYRMRRYLEVLTEGLAGSRKYVFSSHNGLTPTLRLDLKDSASAMSDIMKPEGE